MPFGLQVQPGDRLCEQGGVESACLLDEHAGDIAEVFRAAAFAERVRAALAAAPVGAAGAEPRRRTRERRRAETDNPDRVVLAKETRG